MGTYGKNQGAIVAAFIHLFIQIAKSAIFCTVGFGDIPSICFVSELLYEYSGWCLSADGHGQMVVIHV